MKKLTKYLFVFTVLALLGLTGLMVGSKNIRKSAQIQLVDKIGGIAASRMANNPQAEGSVAAEFINIPIEARNIAEGIYQATGVGNTHLITTAMGDVLFDTGLAIQVPKQMKVLNPYLGANGLSHIIVSHSHADHLGGVKFWRNDKAEIVTHQEFVEEQRYLAELQPYFWHRNRTLFPFMPENPPKRGLLAYGGIQPTITVKSGEPYKFSQGGVDFVLYALSGAEGSDNLLLWLPQKKILFSGDFFGPLFPQFPNVFTMRGEKIRKPIEYIRSLEVVMDLKPAIIVPSHKLPIKGENEIMNGLARIHGATKYVHNAVITGMNDGKTVEQLMAEISLPPDLQLSQQHGRVSWAVKSIWEYYATWFHFDKTTELYAIPMNEVNGDIVALAGADNLADKAQHYVNNGEPIKALHLLDIMEEHAGRKPLEIRVMALGQLLERAENGLKNSYEIYWLRYRLRETQNRLQALDEVKQ